MADRMVSIAVITPAGHAEPPMWEHGPIRWPERVPVVERNTWPPGPPSAPLGWARRLEPGVYESDVPGEEWSPMYLRGEDSTWWLAEIAVVDSDAAPVQLGYATARYIDALTP